MASLRVILQLTSAIVIVIGLVLNIVALSTPNWQIVNIPAIPFNDEPQMTINSGLFVSCTRRNASDIYNCTYRLIDNGIGVATSGEHRTPIFYGWQRTVFRIIVLGQCFALFALILFIVAQITKSPRKTANVSLSMSLGCAALLSLIGALTFTIHSQTDRYRFFHVNEKAYYERHLGYSFLIQLIGAICHLIAFLLAMSATIHIFRKDDLRQQQRALQQHEQRQKQLKADDDDYPIKSKSVDNEHFLMRQLTTESNKK